MPSNLNFQVQVSAPPISLSLHFSLFPVSTHVRGFDMNFLPVFFRPLLYPRARRDKNVGGGARKGEERTRQSSCPKKLRARALVTRRQGLNNTGSLRWEKLSATRHVRFVPRRARPGGPEIIVPEFQSSPRAHYSVRSSVQLLSYFF